MAVTHCRVLGNVEEGFEKTSLPVSHWRRPRRRFLHLPASWVRLGETVTLESNTTSGGRQSQQGYHIAHFGRNQDTRRDQGYMSCLFTELELLPWTSYSLGDNHENTSAICPSQDYLRS